MTGPSLPVPSAPRLVLAVAGLLLSTGCFTRIQWNEFQTGQPMFEDAWGGFQRIAVGEAYPPAPGSDRGTRRYESRWRTMKLPFRKGYRKRLHAEFEQVENVGWTIRFHAEQQQVEDFARSMEPRDQDWEPDGQDTGLESRIMQKLIFRFRSERGRDLPDLSPRGDSVDSTGGT